MGCLWPSTALVCKAVVVSVLPRVRGACWEGIAGDWILREEPLYLVEASLPPRGRGASATDDQGSETGEVKISWSGGHLGGRSGAKVSNGNSRNGRHGNSRSGDYRKGLHGWNGGWCDHCVDIQEAVIEAGVGGGDVYILG